MDFGWRWVIGASSFISLWALIISRYVPESPYWLAEKGRTEEATQGISQLSEGAINAVIRSVEGHSGSNMAFMNIFRGSTLRTTIVQTVINFCFSWGYWGLASWMPTLLAERGLTAPEGLGFIAISALFMFPGYVSASYLTGKFGRKKIMLLYVFVAAIAGFGFAYSATIPTMYFWNFTLSFFSLGAWGVWNTWLGEIYDTNTRGAGTGWGVSAQRVANAVAPVVIGTMLATTSFLQTVSFISMFLAITFAAALFLPETEGQALG
jgi:putative MFS transporter